MSILTAGRLFFVLLSFWVCVRDSERNRERQLSMSPSTAWWDVQCLIISPASGLGSDANVGHESIGPRVHYRGRDKSLKESYIIKFGDAKNGDCMTEFKLLPLVGPDERPGIQGLWMYCGLLWCTSCYMTWFWGTKESGRSLRQQQRVWRPGGCFKESLVSCMGRTTQRGPKYISKCLHCCSPYTFVCEQAFCFVSTTPDSWG